MHDWNDGLWLDDDNCWRFKCVVELFYAVLLFVYLRNIFLLVYLQRQKFSFQTHKEQKIGAENRFLFPAPENGVDLWCQFLQHVSWA